MQITNCHEPILGEPPAPLMGPGVKFAGCQSRKRAQVLSSLMIDCQTYLAVELFLQKDSFRWLIRYADKIESAIAEARVRHLRPYVLIWP